jgi:hypothetical protein
MPDSARGRALLVASLVAAVLVHIGFGSLGRNPTWLEQFGRPLIVILASLLVWQGRLWARWIVLLAGLGALFAGPLAVANGLPILSIYSLVFWAVTAVYAAVAWALFKSADVREYLSSRTRAQAGA